MADIDLGGVEVNSDPDGFTDRTRATGPIQWSDRHRAWVLIGHRAVTDGFLDGRLSSDRTPTFRRQLARRGPAFERTFELLSGWMVFRDRPIHTHLRDAVRRVFTPRMVDDLRAAVADIVDELLAALPERGLVDLKAQFSAPLPAAVIADLLGVPRTERPRFQRWSAQLSDIVVAVAGEQVDEAATVAATDEFISFFGALIEHRRRHPGDDLVSRVVAGGNPDELTALELMGACTILLFAGHETTTDLITASVGLLADRPDEVRRLVAGEVDETAADELVRLGGPVKTMYRKVIDTHEREGHRFEHGDTVYLGILTANRDPERFPDPHRLDLAREPNPHVGFGWGRHLCLGANLARLEATMALRRLYERFPDLSLSLEGPGPVFEGNPTWRALPELWVQPGPAAPPDGGHRRGGHCRSPVRSYRRPCARRRRP